MLVNNDSFRFILQLHVYGARSFSHTRVYDPRTRTACDGVLIDACDLSHAEVITPTALLSNSATPGRTTTV